MAKTTDKSTQPDFAYPQQVSAMAEKKLQEAIKTGNGKEVIKSLIDYTIAQALIDSDNLSAAINKIETIAESEKDPCTKSLLYTFLCDVYTNVYVGNRWIYDERNNPQSPLPEDIKTWDGQQFRDKITSLCDSALANTHALQATKLSEYNDIIKFDSRTLIYYPTLYDFVARHIIGTLGKLNDNKHILSIDWLCRHDVYLQLRQNITSPVVKRILSLYNDLLTFHQNAPAPFIDCDLSRIEFIYNNVQHSKESISDIKYNAIKAVYEKFNDNEYSDIALNALYLASKPSSENKWLYNSIQRHIKKFPNSPIDLNSILQDISKKVVEISVPRTIVPNSTFKVNITNHNTDSYILKIYRYKNNLTRPTRRTTPNAENADLVKEIQLNCDSIIPFIDKTAIDITLERPGFYTIIPDFLEGIKSSTGFGVIHCTEINLLDASFGKSKWAFVINPQTGAPIQGADIYKYGNNSELTDNILKNKIATTDETGTSDISDVTDNFKVIARKGLSSSNTESVYTSEYSSYGTISECFTDLAIYRPGDEVKWSAVLYCVVKDARKILKGQTFTVVLYDANHSKLSSDTYTTDNWGRISGTFNLPKDGLTGNYHIAVYDEFGLDHLESTYFKVSDYKLPSFFLETTGCKKDTVTGDIVLTGKVQSYAGIDLSGIEITLNLSVAPFSYWRFMNNADEFYATNTTTDNNGCFSFTFSDEFLKNSPYPDGIFNAKITALSATCESQTTSKLFANRPAYRIAAGLNENIEADKPFMPHISVIDLDGNAVTKSVIYKILTDSTTVKEGDIDSLNDVIDLSGIQSGAYKIEFSMADGNATPQQHDIIIYRKSDKLPPVVDKPIWIPETNFTISENSTSILYGTSAPETHILCTIWNDKKILDRKWITKTPGMHYLDIEIPEGETKVNVTMVSVYNFKHSNFVININKENSEPRLNFTAESFRDKITPLSTETWTFKTTDNYGNGTTAAVLMRMYSKALDALYQNSWSLYPRQINAPHLNCNVPGLNDVSRSRITERIDLSIATSITPPGFITYGYNLASEIVRNRGIVFYDTPGLGSTDEIVVMELKSEIKLDAFASAPSHKIAATNSTIESAEQEFSYRLAEVPLAFFNPTLASDSLGNLSFSFTVPNANTTWAFDAIAYDEQLLTDKLSFDVIANKPVMVEPNMPRFLRQGDQAVIKASVINNSDSTQEIKTIVEIFDHISGKVIKTHEYDNTLAGGETAVVSTIVSAPGNASMLGYRIKSSTATFADGEQSLIAVLPSSTPVIETHPFYLGSDENHFSTHLPKIPEGSQVTLEFCENPTWYCVTALPGLRAENGQTSLSAMAAIFSAAIADGIIRNNPEIATALHQWQHSDKSDSVLVSMLERNQDLKTVLLNASPWVLDASSDTERMTRLALLFDKKEIANAYDSNIDKLAKLVRQQGGWGWISSSAEMSEWCTLNILSMYGRLKQLGYTPKDTRLSKMIETAVKAVDNIYARQYAKYPDRDYTSYVIARDFYPEIKQSTAAKRVTAATVQRLIDEWKALDVTPKAIAAIILNDNGYHSTAQQILNSLREYASMSKSQGMWWPALNSMNGWTMSKVGATSIILDAFHAIEPSCKEVDLIRQWLILQKEAKNWGSSVTTCDVISSILNCGTKWLNSARGVEVIINNQPITPSDIEKATGYFRNDISKLSTSQATLSIFKTTENPAWGAIYCQYNDVMDNVKAQSCEAVSIEKRLLKQVNKPNGIAWEIADNISVGDRIKVELTIKTSRDMDYVAIIDDRAACFEPVEQLPTPIYTEGIYFYRENRDDATNIYVTHLPKGTYMLTYELFANNSGTYMSGIASAQSQYAPALSAHSAGSLIKVK